MFSFFFTESKDQQPHPPVQNEGSSFLLDSPLTSSQHVRRVAKGEPYYFISHNLNPLIQKTTNKRISSTIFPNRYILSLLVDEKLTT